MLDIPIKPGNEIQQLVKYQLQARLDAPPCSNLCGREESRYQKGNGLLNQVCIIECAISPDNDQLT